MQYIRAMTDYNCATVEHSGSEQAACACWCPPLGQSHSQSRAARCCSPDGLLAQTWPSRSQHTTLLFPWTHLTENTKTEVDKVPGEQRDRCPLGLTRAEERLNLLYAEARESHQKEVSILRWVDKTCSTHIDGARHRHMGSTVLLRTHIHRAHTLLHETLSSWRSLCPASITEKALIIMRGGRDTGSLHMCITLCYGCLGWNWEISVKC